MRFVTRTIHAYLDYPVAISLMVLPFLLGLGAGNPLAKWLAVGTGATAFILTLLTNHELGVVKVVPYWLHVAVDRVVGVRVRWIASKQCRRSWLSWRPAASPRRRDGSERR